MVAKNLQANGSLVTDQAEASDAVSALLIIIRTKLLRRP